MTEVPDELWTLKDFAEWLRITVWAARGMLKRRQLPPESIVKIGRRVRIRIDIVRDWYGKRQAT